MFSFEFYLICLAFTGYVFVSRRWAIDRAPARRRRPREGVPHPPAGRGGGAQGPVAVPRRRVPRPSVVSFSDDIEIIEDSSLPCASPVPRRDNPQPSTSGNAFQRPPFIRPSILGSSAPVSSAPSSAPRASAPSGSGTHAVIISRHPTEELDAEPPAHEADRPAAIGASVNAATLDGSPVQWRERRVGTKTFYWETGKFGLQLIRSPPDLTGNPKLALGDLFYYQTLTRYQLWIWTLDDSEKPCWKAIRYGFQREDGRRLIVTPTQRKPGWVKPERWSQLTHAALCLVLAYKALQWVYCQRPREPVRRTQTLTYTYSATATVQSQCPTYLVFPAPPLPRRGPAAPPTILKDFTNELREIGFRAVGDAELGTDKPTYVSAVATGSRVQPVARSRSVLRIYPVSDPAPGDEGVAAVGKGKERAVSPVAGPSRHVSPLPPNGNVQSNFGGQPQSSSVDVDLFEASAGSTRSDLDWSRSPSPLTELSGSSESETEVQGSAEQRSTQNTLLRAYSSIDETDYLQRKGRTQSASEGRDKEFKVYWWETKSSTPIQHPLDLSRRRELAEEDLFLHRYGDNQRQFWIWITEPGRATRWKKIKEGYRRPSDGRCLTVTETHKKPSWLEAGWYETRVRQNRLS
ncbi:hypothetical protein L227DRAFT_616791 [Lentinus tigrinus ALCF2SS1-6]|nr:hypothetical protein L227DRAFT_616791 [Lentinus tigrinus ALCF2SS1-6]